MLAALIFAVVGLASCPPRSLLFGFAAITSVALVITVVATSALPEIRVEDGKIYTPRTLYSAWGPVFRVDVIQLGPDSSGYLLVHDGTFGSGIRRFDGNPASLGRYAKDPRSIPFHVLGKAPARELIIGSAGGNEILASLYYHAPNIEAVELNPVTVSLLTNHFADYTGHLPKNPAVHLHQGDGRSYLARTNAKYDLTWYVAPDSYAATNAASSGAFVLSESYLYTTQMIKTTLQHLTDDGIMVVQFGELNFDTPNRTSRYIVTARKALQQLGVSDPNNHLLVAAQLTNSGALSTIIVKRTPFTPGEADRFLGSIAHLPEQHAYAAPGHAIDNGIVSQLASGHERPGRVDRVALVEEHHARQRRRPVLLALHSLSRRAVQHHETARQPRPRRRHRRTRAAVAPRDRDALRGRVPAGTVLRRAPKVASPPGEAARRPCTSPRSGSGSCSSRSR